MLKFSLDVTACIKLNRSDSALGPLALHSKGTCFESGNRIYGLKNMILFLRLSRQHGIYSHCTTSSNTFLSLFLRPCLAACV